MPAKSAPTSSTPSDTAGAVLDQKQLECLSSAGSWDVFTALIRIGPASVGEIGNAIGKAPDTLYYHVRRLVGCGLLRSRGKRAATTRHEEVYEAASYLVRVDPSNRSPAYLAARTRLFASVLRTFRRHVSSALEHPTHHPQQASSQPQIQSLLVRLHPDHAEEIVGKMKELFALVREKSLTEGGELYSFLGVTTPVEERARIDDPDDLP